MGINMPKSNALSKAQKVTVIDVFKGLDESQDSDTQLEKGYAIKATGYRITQDYKLVTMEGYKPIFDSLGDGYIQGQWYGKIADTFMHIFNYNGTLYKRVNGVNTAVGNIANAPTTFFYFGTKLYILDGTNYKSFDGTNLSDVAGYRPLVAINAPPIGGGTVFEELNVLNGTKHQTFSPDGTATVFQLAENNIQSVDFVRVDGINKTLTTDYTVDIVNGKVTFTTAAKPVQGIGTVDIGWTKGSGNPQYIKNCRFAIDYGGANDTRIFFFGNPNFKNRRYWSGLANRTPCAEYIPANNYSDEGTGQYAITDIKKHYNTQVIYLEVGARYSNIELKTDALGNINAEFPSYPLNDTRGNISYGQARIIKNNPVTLCNDGIYEWSSSTIRDERNNKCISDKARKTLASMDMSKAVTIDWEEMGELWVCENKVCVIYNYRNNTWYTRENVDAKNFIIINGNLYFGTKGTISKFDKELTNDMGTVVKKVYDMGFNAFGAEYITKYINEIYVSLKPESKSRVDIKYQIDKNNTDTQTVTALYRLLDFRHIDFRSFTFMTSYNPQPFKFVIRANGFAYFNLCLFSESLTEKATVLSITIPVIYGGPIR